MRSLLLTSLLLLTAAPLRANPPVASYLFPAGGQRGTTVKMRVGGLFLYSKCGFEMLGAGVQAPAQITRMPTLFFEGPLIPLPDSQQAEDYPQDMAAEVKVAADALLGLRRARVWTAEGAASGLQFVVGDLPEIVEEEIDGDPIPVAVRLPLTINGRIFPRENVDHWAFTARKGQSVTCEINAARIGSPLDAHLAILDAQGRVLAENDDGHGADPFLHFVAPADGTYRVQVRDVANKGGPAYVYRLTLTSDPYVDRVYPLGGRRGSRLSLELHGQGVPATPVEAALPDQAAHDYLHCFAVAGKSTNPVLLDVDDLPEVLKSAPSQQFTAPAVLNGRISKAGEKDRWLFNSRKGDVLHLEMRAVQLGSPLLGVLSVHDAAGKQLARAEAGGTQLDPQLTFTVPTDGGYSIEVADRFARRGGPTFAYRLRVAAPAKAADFHLRLAADTAIIPRGGKAKLRVQAERQGYTGPIALTIEGLPAGVKADAATVPATQNAVDVSLAAEAAARIGAGRVTIRGSATVEGKAVTRTASLVATPGQPVIDSVLLTVTLPVPFKVTAGYEMRLAPRGSVMRRKYRIDRGGFAGPFEVRMADRQARHLQGAHGPTLTVPAGVSEFEYPLTMPAWMETGRTCRVCVMTVAKVKDGDAEHEICFSAVGQNDQIISVVETGRLGVELAKDSLAAVPGQTVQLPFKITRAPGLTGAVKVELALARHVRGLTAEPVLVPADRDAGVLTLRFGMTPGPFNLPATILATLGEMTAEAKLELTAEKP